MDHQPMSAAPDARGALKFVASVAWKSKWLIGIATAFAAALAFELAPTNTVEAGGGTAPLRIGLALKTGAPLTPSTLRRYPIRDSDSRRPTVN